MKYYDEEKMKNIRLKIEEELLSWSDVKTRKMYGCPCYKNKEKMFAFLVTDGIVLTKPSEKDKLDLSKKYDVKPFQAGNRTMKNWPQIFIDEKSDIKKLLPFIKNSYNQSQK